MRLRLALLVATLLPGLTLGANLAAQDASPYLPLEHWAMPFVEHLMRAAALAGPGVLLEPEATLLRQGQGRSRRTGARRRCSPASWSGLCAAVRRRRMDHR